MKFGAFVLGGLAGAAVVMLMRNRNMNMSAVANGFGQMFRQRMNQVKETAVEKGLNVKFPGFMTQSYTNHASDGLDQVEQLASKDPKVQHEIHEILNENGQPRA